VYGRVLTEEGSDREIHDRDLAWLKEADCLVAEVTTPSLGVGYEIGRAVEWGKPILCLYRRSCSRALSAMIAGSGGVKLRDYENTADLDEIFREFFVAG
jgi:nucleoside 2-deoxyribosyltransferase